MKKFMRRLRMWLTPAKMCRHCCLTCEYAEKCEPIVGASTWGECLFRWKYRLGLAREGIDFMTAGMEDEPVRAANKLRSLFTGLRPALTTTNGLTEGRSDEDGQ